MMNYSGRTLLTFILLSHTWMIPSVTQAEPVLLDRTIALIGASDILLQSEFNQHTKNQEHHQQILETLIDKKIQHALAQKLGLTVTHSQLEQTIGQQATQKNLSVSNYLNQEAQRMQLSVAQVREQIKENILFTLVQQNQVGSRITLTDEEIEKLAKTIDQQYRAQTQYRVSHLRMKFKDGQKNDAKAIGEMSKRLAQYKEQVLTGQATFAALAQQYSDDQSASQGGDQGWFKANDMPSIMFQALSQAQIGHIAGPIQSPVGVHLFLLTDKKNDLLVQQTQYKAKHLLLKPSIILDDASAQKKLENYRQALQDQKTSFVALAQAHSEDLITKDNGGDLGWINLESLDSNVAQALKQLKPGEISKPVRSALGWHLIQLDATQVVDVTEQALKRYAQNILFTNRLNEESKNWQDTLRNQSYVKIIDADLQ